MLTERQAWARAAKLEGRYGLCSEIDDMLAERVITPGVAQHMTTRLEAYGRKHGKEIEWDFFWPRDVEGNRARVQFCKRQIKALERRKP